MSAARETPVPDSALPRLELAAWAERYGLTAGITARPTSLGLWTEEPVGQVMNRWRAFLATFAARFPTVILSHQVHGTAIQWYEELPPGWLLLDGLDGHATADSGVLLTVTVADCIPVYLAVPETGALALVHAGWRGTAGGVLARAVAVLNAHSPAKSAKIVMHCGVGICGKCYEVGSEVAARFGITAPGAVRLDLRDVLLHQAQALGIAEITSSPWCSMEGPDRFFSHRGSGGRDGRMAAYLGRPRG